MATTGMRAARARWMVVDGLRRWAEGSLSEQAAVELLASWCAGRHLRPGVAWVRPCARPGWYWLDADALTTYAATRTADERRVLLARRCVDRWRPVDSPDLHRGEGGRMSPEVAWFVVALDFCAGVVVLLNVVLHQLHAAADRMGGR